MSKRFGRNQRRKMREQAENLSAALVREQGLLRHQSGVIARQREALDDVAATLGNYFAGLPAKTIEVERLLREIRLPAPIPMAQLVYRPSEEIEQVVRHAVHVLGCIAPEHVLDDLRGCMHVRVRTRYGDAAYALSDMAARTAPREALIRQLSEELAIYIGRKVLPPQGGRA
jgi:hypothetical protein